MRKKKTNKRRLYPRHAVSSSLLAQHGPVYRHNLFILSLRKYYQRSTRTVPVLARAFVITSCDMSTLFCRRSEIVCLTYLQKSDQNKKLEKPFTIYAYSSAALTSRSINILCRHVSITVETKRQLSRRTVYYQRVRLSGKNLERGNIPRYPSNPSYHISLPLSNIIPRIAFC